MCGPAADDLGDVFLVDFLLEHPRWPCCMLAQPRLLVLDLLLELPAAGRIAARTPWRSRRHAARARSRCRTCSSSSFSLRPALDRLLFLLPVRRQAVLVLLEVGQLLLELLQPLLRRLVRLLAQRLALDLELHDAALDLVELGRHRVDLHAQARGGLVDQVDRLVGQEAVGDVAIGEHGRRHQRRVLELARRDGSRSARAARAGC